MAANDHRLRWYGYPVGPIFYLSVLVLLLFAATANLNSASQSSDKAWYFVHAGPEQGWQKTIGITNLDQEGASLEGEIYGKSGSFLGRLPSITSLEDNLTETLENLPLDSESLKIASPRNLHASLMLRSLDGTKSEAISALDQAATQLDFPPLTGGDVHHKSISLLNISSRITSLQLIGLDRAGKELARLFLPDLAPMGSHTFAVRELFNEAVLEKISTVRVISELGIVGVQLVNPPDGDLVALPALTTTSREWLFPIATKGGDLALWTAVNLFNPGQTSSSLTIEAFDAQNTSLGIIQTTTIPPGAVNGASTANIGGVIPSQATMLRVKADSPISGYAVLGVMEGMGVTATLGIPADEQTLAGLDLTGTKDGNLLTAFPLIRTTNGTLKSAAATVGQREWRESVRIDPTGAAIQGQPENERTTAVQNAATSGAGLKSVTRNATAEDTPLFIGTSPPVVNSGGALSFKLDEQKFLWTSSDPILSDIDTGDFAVASRWNFFSGTPARLVFVASGGGATFFGDVLFEPYNRAVVDVVKGQKRVRYLLTTPLVCACLECLSAQQDQPSVKVDLVIHNGLDGVSGGQAIAEADEETKGAVTVANLNDTDGDGTVDKDDNDVSVSGANPPGRNEHDLMKLIIKKPDPNLGGKVKLKRVSGEIKLWEKSTKETEITLTNDAVEFETKDLDKTLWIEARAPSAALRDIVLELEYKGCKDTVKATALFVNLRRTFRVRAAAGDDNTLPDNLDRQALRDDITMNAVAVDGSLYGIGPFERRIQGGALADTMTGGKMLFEWEILPHGVEDLGVVFDVTRQLFGRDREIKIGTGALTVPIGLPDINFPEDEAPKKDNETPNDDGTTTDEDNNPKNHFIYSFDSPGSGINANADFLIKRDFFREWVRIRLSGAFENRNGRVEGSRASNKVDWHLLNYLKRGANGNWEFDQTATSNSAPVRAGLYSGQTSHPIRSKAAG